MLYVVLDFNTKASLKFSAIDIGSNAVRMQVVHVFEREGILSYKRLEYTRFPLRLGIDVFDKGYITAGTRDKLGKLLLAYKLMQDLYEVDEYMVCATSALRDSSNKTEVKHWLEGYTGLTVNVIDGQKEAEMIGLAIQPYIDPRHDYLHIDVGGGSTELNVYHHGKKTASESFQAGHVRNAINAVAVWPEMDAWMAKYVPDAAHRGRRLYAIASGGNIGKLIEIYNRQHKKKGDKLTYSQLLSLYLDLSDLDLEERSFDLGLNPDRADVIVPAAEIYLHVMRSSGSVNVFSPDVGLRDGMILSMMQKNGMDLSKVQL